MHRKAHNRTLVSGLGVDGFGKSHKVHLSWAMAEQGHPILKEARELVTMALRLNPMVDYPMARTRGQEKMSLGCAARYMVREAHT